VTKCPGDAIRLQKKPENQLYDPPENHMDMYIRMARDRGMM
jgi:hypothetical protein